MLWVFSIVLPDFLSESIGKCHLTGLDAMRKLLPCRIVLLPELSHGEVAHGARCVGLESRRNGSRTKPAVFFFTEYSNARERPHQSKKRWSVRPALRSELVNGHW